MTYSNLMKQMLMASIDELSKTPENFAVHPDKDFTRNRKIGFHDFLLLLLTMEDDCLREELYHFFGRTDETPSKAAFYHQRAKLKDNALWELLQIFNQKLQPTLYRNRYRLVASIITDKWMIAIALIMKVKGSAFLSAVCIKKSGIQIQNHSLWHLNAINFLPKHSANHKELV